MTTITTEERELITIVLKHYLKDEYKLITDFDAAIDNRTEVESGIFQYDCPCQTIYLDSNHYAVTYGKQYVLPDELGDGDLYYYYDFRDPNYYGNDGLTRISPYEWMRDSSGGGGV